MSEAKLYTIPGSHPALSVAMMLDYKGVPYKRVDLLPVVSKAVVRALGFPGVTVPALTIDGQKLQGSIPIARALDGLVPDPPLLPGDPEKRAGVLEAERVGDRELQHPVRQIIWWLLKRNGGAMGSYLEGSHTGVPIPVATRTAFPLVAGSVYFNRADDVNVKAAIASLPPILDQLDAWVADGTIGNDEPRPTSSWCRRSCWR
jgi:glutathione S-transferase